MATAEVASSYKTYGSPPQPSSTLNTDQSGSKLFFPPFFRWQSEVLPAKGQSLLHFSKKKKTYIELLPLQTSRPSSFFPTSFLPFFHHPYDPQLSGTSPNLRNKDSAVLLCYVTFVLEATECTVVFFANFFNSRWFVEEPSSLPSLNTAHVSSLLGGVPVSPYSIFVAVVRN